MHISAVIYAQSPNFQRKSTGDDLGALHKKTPTPKITDARKVPWPRSRVPRWSGSPLKYLPPPKHTRPRTRDTSHSLSLSPTKLLFFLEKKVALGLVFGPHCQNTCSTLAPLHVLIDRVSSSTDLPDRFSCRHRSTQNSIFHHDYALVGKSLEGIGKEKEGGKDQG